MTRLPRHLQELAVLGPPSLIGTRIDARHVTEVDQRHFHASGFEVAEHVVALEVIVNEPFLVKLLHDIAQLHEHVEILFHFEEVLEIRVKVPISVVRHEQRRRLRTDAEQLGDSRNILELKESQSLVVKTAASAPEVLHAQGRAVDALHGVHLPERPLAELP